ncbi:zinc finger MYM-type protein 4-like isoform X2 [Scleropages formosus]|uniref:Zinc finger MYM-type protein 4-like n=1 Tax=Scleropages formosus TaxID=113540 RepID=A0A8C9V8V7_SCLFO|nr:zinc finger MYM-type protein 4-like isoform X2 [Scleropages formosus]
MAESETERCQHLNPEGGVGELVHEGGGVEQTSDNAMTSEPTFLEEDGEEELDGVPVFGADDEEWSTETLRNESQQVAHTLSSKTQVSVSVLGTADMLRSDSRHDADVLRSDTQEDTDMLRSDNQHNTDTLKSYSQHDTDTLRSECRQGTDPPRSDCQHDIDTLRSESQHTSCTQQTSIQNATDSPENVSGQTFGMLWSSSRHAANTQSNESQSRTQHNKHRADSVWSESQHPSATLQNNSGHPPLHMLLSGSEHATDTQRCNNQYSAETVSTGLGHTAHTLWSDGQQATSTQSCDNQRAEDMLPGRTRHAVDTVQSDSRQNAHQQAHQLPPEPAATKLHRSWAGTAGTGTDPQRTSSARAGGPDVAQCWDGEERNSAEAPASGQLVGGTAGELREDPLLGVEETYPCLTIKEEVVDEEYEFALSSQPQPKVIKEEPRSPEVIQQHKTSEELRICSVFSVQGSSCSTISGTAVAMRSTPLEASNPPPVSSSSPPRGTPQASCSGCSKVLQKGQTAFQRKGSSQLFCSTVCLTGYNLPPAARTPRKRCHHCLQEIGNPKDVISAPVDAVGTLKDFCSPGCLSFFTATSSSGVAITCSVCTKTAVVRHEVSYQGTVHKLCSDSCFSRFRSNNKLTMNCCETCGGYCYGGSAPSCVLQMEGTTQKFCSPACVTVYKQRSTKAAPCAHCHIVRSLPDMLEHSSVQGSIQLYCSPNCLSAGQQWISLSGVSFPCHHCHALAVPQYHLPMTDGSLLNFCSYTCAVSFQAVFKVTPQLTAPSSAAGTAAFEISATVSAGSVHGASVHSSSTHALPRAAGLPLHCEPLQGLPSSCGSSQGHAPKQAPPLSQENVPNQAISSLLWAQAPKQVPKGVPDKAQLLSQGQGPKPAPTLIYRQVPNQAIPCGHTPNQALPSVAHGLVKITCRQCHCLFASKPELFQFKGRMVLFCGKTCCEEFRMVNCVTARCEYCNINKVLKDMVKFDHVERAFCSEGCKLLYKHDVSKRCGSPCRTCAFCTNMSTKMIHSHFGGKLEEFCQEDCMSRYTVLFYQMARCDQCSRQGHLSESLRWLGIVKHFCDLRCMLLFCSRQQAQDSPAPSLVSMASPGTVSAVPAQPSTAGRPALTSMSFDRSKETGLSLVTKDTTPVIASVVSLASAPMRQPYVTANTALQGSVPAARAQPKTSGDASTQTDTMPPPLASRRTLKNKALQCRPVTQNKGTVCKPHMQSADTQTDEDKKMKLILLPVPVPVFIPLPLHLYTRYMPVPLGLPLPVPVPLCVTPGLTGTVEMKDGAPPEVVEKDDERGKPLAREDQGSSYSADLELESVSTLHSPGKEAPPTAHTCAPSAKPTAPAMLDLEADFPLELYSPMDHSLTSRHRGRRRPRDGFPPRKRGRKRAACVVEAGVARVALPPAGGSKLHHTYGVNAWRSWVQSRARQLEREQPKVGRRPVALNEDVLQCSSVELRYGLCRFVHHVRRPGGEAYSPDSILYLCLGIQQYLFENGRIENIFTDLFYSRFTLEITRMLKDWRPALLPGGGLRSRVQEEFLWECKQLGAYSPMVLLNTLLFFSTKIFQLKSIIQHRRLSFARITRSTRTGRGGKTSCLRFRLPRSTRSRVIPALPAKRKMIVEEEEEEVVMEMPENTENPLRCPVRLYEFYLSKCSDAVKQRSDLFYLQPERSCVPSSPLWFSTQPLEGDTLEGMLTRILTVREVHLAGGRLSSTAPSANADEEASD